MQHMFGTIGCPQGKQVVLGVLERTAATDGDESGSRFSVNIICEAHVDMEHNGDVGKQVVLTGRVLFTL